MALQLQTLESPHADSAFVSDLFSEAGMVRLNVSAIDELVKQPARKSLAAGRSFCPQRRFRTNTSHAKVLTAIQRAPQL